MGVLWVDDEEECFCVGVVPFFELWVFLVFVVVEGVEDHFVWP